MLKVDIATAIVLYLLSSLTLVLGVWVWYALRHRPKSLQTERKTALRCDICLHVFIASTEANSERCPRCRSWVRVGSAAAHAN